MPSFLPRLVCVVEGVVVVERRLYYWAEHSLQPYSQGRTFTVAETYAGKKEENTHETRQSSLLLPVSHGDQK